MTAFNSLKFCNLNAKQEPNSGHTTTQSTKALSTPFKPSCCRTSEGAYLFHKCLSERTQKLGNGSLSFGSTGTVRAAAVFLSGLASGSAKVISKKSKHLRHLGKR